MILYHLTKEKNLDSILSKGLIADKNSGLTVNKKSKFKKVFLTNDIPRIVVSQAGEKWCKRYNPIVLEIEIEEKCITPVHYRDGATYTLSDFEFVVGSFI